MNSSKPGAMRSVMCTLVGSVGLSGTAFSMQSTAQDNQQAVESRTVEKLGEGTCGMEIADTSKDGKLSRAEFDVVHPNARKVFNDMDRNMDGYIDPLEAKASADEEYRASEKQEIKPDPL